MARPPARLRAAALALALVATAVGAGDAAAESGDSALSASAAFAMVAVDTREPAGAALAVDWQRDLTDAVALAITGSYSLHGATATAPAQGSLPGGPLHVATASAGVRYAVDYLRIVPFGEAALGGMYVGGESAGVDGGLRGAVIIGVGADVLASRSFSYGFVIRMHTFLPDADSAPVYIYAGPRVSWRWNRF